MNIRKAVFPVAGFGTRFCQLQTIKELLPILDKPLIQYAAEEAIAAGINTLIFVTGRNKRAIEDHFDANIELELALKAYGKHEQADMIRIYYHQVLSAFVDRQSNWVLDMQFLLPSARLVMNHLQFYLLTTF